MTVIVRYPDCPEHPAFQLMLRVNFISGHGDAVGPDGHEDGRLSQNSDLYTLCS
jgi:hypothetical protein